ncbi:MAG: NAD-dependent epimerase/dehydratase family protein [Mariprofundaceae bacterium]|nr:NAD-dependent epimerase/dehydratase family protein [Mariprofundaceae bacterium]
MKRVIVTGGTGFIGNHTVLALLKLGYEVHLTSSRHDAFPLQKSNLFFHTCDLLDEAQQKKLFSDVRPSHLLHLAWDVTHGEFWTTENNLRWVQASLSLLKYFHQFGGKRTVFAGTCAEYDWKHGYCVEGLTPLIPNTLYGTCKNSLNSIVQCYCDLNNISHAWGRVFHLYGPQEGSSRFVPSIICSMLRQKTVKCSQGTQIRDFMHVEDVSSAFVHLLNSEVQGDINIASGLAVSLKSVIKLIAKGTNYSGGIDFGAIPMPQSEPSLLVGAVKRLQNEVVFFPKYNLRQGLKSSIQYWERNQV